jgi:membrane protein
MLKATFRSFFEDKGLKLSASLAYTTIFSLGPMLLLIMSLASIFFGQDAIEGKIFSQVNGLLGAEAAKQIQDIIKNIHISGKTHFALTISIITLLVGSTSLFVEIQDSLNMIWRVKAKPKRGWLNFLKNRLLSASLIISLGFLLVVSLIVSGTVLALSESLTKYLSDISVLLITIINFILTFLITTFIFGIVFKVLPDAKIKWKNVKAGAIFTALFFMGGRYLIGLYIEKAATGSTYGAAGAIIIILVWVYFTSAILYMGAEFTQVYSEAMGTPIQPSEYAVHVEEKEHEKNVSILPPRHKELQEKG